MASSNGDFVFSRKAFFDQNSGAFAIVINTCFISPSFSKNVLAILSTNVFDGSSLTKRTANLLHIKRAVAVLCANMVINFSPSS